MAQAGSVFKICSNWRWDSSYQKSCTRAMARLIAACCDATQETGKETVPGRSGVCARTGRTNANVTSGVDQHLIVTEYSGTEQVHPTSLARERTGPGKRIIPK